MKILQVIDTLDIGGAERMFVTLTNLLHSEGISVSVMILVKSGSLKQELDRNIMVYELNRGKRFEKNKMKQFADILSKFDIVHTHLKHNYRYSVITAKRFAISKPKIILHDHSHNLSVSKWHIKHLKDYLFKSVLKPHYYIGVSQSNCDWAISYLKMKPSRCYLLYNVVGKRISKLKDDSLKKGVVMVSNISRIKNIEFAIRLVHKMKMSLTIYGQIKDVVYYEELKVLISELGLKKNVTFVHNCTNIQSELHIYQFGIHTSLKETGPLVLIEYMAQGLPFVSSSSGHVYDILKNELTECFVNSFEMDVWISKLKFLNDFESKRLDNLYNSYFNPNEYLKKCLSIYQNIQNS